MTAARLAELFRLRASTSAELARLDSQIADELADAGEASPVPEARRPRPREPYLPPPQEVSPIARARAKRVVARIVTTK